MVPEEHAADRCGDHPESPAEGGAPLPEAPLCDGVVVLEPSTTVDARDVAAAMPVGEPGVWEPAPGPYDVETARCILGEWETARRRGSRVSLTVRAAAGGRFLGAVVLMVGTPERPLDATARGALEIAWWVVPGERCAGVARRAVALVAGWARAAPGIDLLWAEVDPANAASRRVALGAGFVEAERLERESGPVVIFSLGTAA